VAFVTVFMHTVVNVDVIAKSFSDDLRLRHLTRNPLKEGGWFPIEIPLNVQLIFFTFVVVKVTVQKNVFGT
jgi:hypothetical protein